MSGTFVHMGVLLLGGLVAACDTPKPESSAGDVPAAAAAARPADTATTEHAPRRVVVNGVDLTGVGYDKGEMSAPVVVVNLSDFGCPFCGSFARETEPVIERDYVKTGKVFFKYVPFVMGMFPNGDQAARTAECAAEQGKFWPMHDRLFAAQTEWKKALSPFPVMQSYAASLGLDATRFSRCYSSRQVHPRTRQANAVADRLGVRVTPTFVVNGRLVEGALPLPQFRELLDAAVSGRK